MVLVCSVAFLVGLVGFAPAQEEANAQSSTSASTQPNIVFVLTDDLDHASAFKMPQIRSLLIEEGTSFEKAFVSHPICCPSRATILTGLYDHNHGVKGNAPPEGGFQTFVDEGHEENTIGTSLQEAGYRTAFFGKYLNQYGQADPTHVPPGWDEWYGKLNEQQLYDYRINENGEVASYRSEEEDFYTDVLSGQAADFVSRAASNDQPFFAYVAPTAPHSPATPAERHKGAFADEEAPRPPSFDEEDVSDKPAPYNIAVRISEEEASNIDDYYRQRLESMLAVDEMVGSLVDELEAAGELENTYIVFTSDNGWFQGEHRIQSTKNRPYEEAARVPLFVRGPGVATGAKTEKLALNTDFAPAFADLAGTTFPDADGRSLEPLLHGEEPQSWRSAVLLEQLRQEGDGGEGNGKAEAKGKAKGKTGEGKEGKTGGGGVPKAGPGGAGAFEAVRTEGQKYVEYQSGERELYDLANDPYELDNLYESADPSLLEDLKAKLDALKSCSEEGCREAEDAP
ncbi:MAG: sulfatase [Actinomycetota bacterium]|nr:sulfatase [Actinomycetota bacterium]